MAHHRKREEANSARRKDKNHNTYLYYYPIDNHKIEYFLPPQFTKRAPLRAGRYCSTAHDVRDAAGGKTRRYPDAER